jgi:hypothetical protein
MPYVTQSITIPPITPTYANVDEVYNFNQKLERENKKIDQALLDDDKNEQDK